MIWNIFAAAVLAFAKSGLSAEAYVQSAG